MAKCFRGVPIAKMRYALDFLQHANGAEAHVSVSHDLHPDGWSWHDTETPEHGGPFKTERDALIAALKAHGWSASDFSIGA